MKDFKKITGAKMLTKAEQRTIKGGWGAGYVCGPFDPIVVCPKLEMCAQDAQGNWYCTN